MMFFLRLFLRSLALSVFKFPRLVLGVPHGMSTVSSAGPVSTFKPFFCAAKAVAVLLDFCFTECSWKKRCRGAFP